MHQSRPVVFPFIAFLLLICVGCKRDDAMLVLTGADTLSISLSIKKEGLECGLVWLLFVYDVGGRPPFVEPSWICPDGVATQGFAMLQKDAALRFLAASSTQGLFSKTQKLYSNRSGKPRSPAPVGAQAFEGDSIADKPDGLAITFTTHDHDWYTYYRAFIPMDTEGLVLAETLIESLDGEARELMERLMLPFGVGE